MKHSTLALIALLSLTPVFAPLSAMEQDNTNNNTNNAPRMTFTKNRKRVGEDDNLQPRNDSIADLSDSSGLEDRLKNTRQMTGQDLRLIQQQQKTQQDLINAKNKKSRKK